MAGVKGSYILVVGFLFSVGRRRMIVSKVGPSFGSDSG